MWAPRRPLSISLLALLLVMTLCAPLATGSLARDPHEPGTELEAFCRSKNVTCKRGCDGAFASSAYGHRCRDRHFLNANEAECSNDFDNRRKCLSACVERMATCEGGDQGAFDTDKTTAAPAPGRPPPIIPRLSDIPRQNPEHQQACGKPFLECQGVCNEAYRAARAAKPPFASLPPVPTECYATCASVLAKCAERTPPKIWPKASDQQNQDWGSCSDAATACFSGCDGMIDYRCRSDYAYYDKFRSQCAAADKADQSCRKNCAAELHSCQERVIATVTDWSPDGPPGAASDTGEQGGDPGCVGLVPTTLGAIIVPAAGDPQCGSPCLPLPGWQLPAGARCGTASDPAGASPGAVAECPVGQHWSTDLGRCHAKN